MNRFYLLVGLYLLSIGSLNAQLVENNQEFKLTIMQKGSVSVATVTSNKTTRQLVFEYRDESIDITDSQINGGSIAYSFLTDKNNVPRWLQKAVAEGEYIKISGKLYLRSVNEKYLRPNLDEKRIERVNFLARATVIFSIAETIRHFRPGLVDKTFKLNRSTRSVLSDAISTESMDEYGFKLKKSHPFKISLNLPKERFSKGDDINVTVVLQNTSDTDLYVCTRATPFDDPNGLMSNIFHLLNDGEKVNYIGRQFKRSAVDVSEMKLIKAGGKLEQVVSLSKHYDLSAPGNYFITYNNNLLHFSLEKTLNGLDIFDTYLMHSNTSKLTVIDETKWKYIDTGSFAMKLKKPNPELESKVRNDSKEINVYEGHRYIVQLKEPFNTSEYIEKLEQEFPNAFLYITNLPTIANESE